MLKTPPCRLLGKLDFILGNDTKMLSHKLALVEPKSQCSSANSPRLRGKGHYQLTNPSFALSQLVVGHNCCRLRVSGERSSNKWL
jgi:hypothetical protein